MQVGCPHRAQLYIDRHDFGGRIHLSSHRVRRFGVHGRQLLPVSQGFGTHRTLCGPSFTRYFRAAVCSFTVLFGLLVYHAQNVRCCGLDAQYAVPRVILSLLAFLSSVCAFIALGVFIGEAKDLVLPDPHISKQWSFFGLPVLGGCGVLLLLLTVGIGCGFFPVVVPSPALDYGSVNGPHQGELVLSYVPLSADQAVVDR